MYRPSAAARTARAFVHQAMAAGTSALSFAADAMMGALISAGTYEQALRENRQIDRAKKRHGHDARNAAAGLNGKRYAIVT